MSVQNCVDVSPKCFMDLQVCIWWLPRKVFCFCFIYQNIYLIYGFKILSDLYNVSASVFFLPWFWWTIPCLREFSTYPLWVLTTILRDYLNVLITKTFIGSIDLKWDANMGSIDLNWDPICIISGYAFNLFGMCCYFGSVEDLKY